MKFSWILQAVSQTEWITVYKIAPMKGSRLKYTLNIIDTPGFGDTRGIERDHAVVDQIRHLFSAKGEQGVLYLDAVCFIVKAPDARLTVVQKYIFHSIMSLFGKDIESNICTLITFADGAKPPVVASLKESKLPFGTTFQFNNSALFSENKTTNATLSPMFWEMGCCSF
jgi:predicted GTPase